MVVRDGYGVDDFEFFFFVFDISFIIAIVWYDSTY
jgi:hypothetical protein